MKFAIREVAQGRNFICSEIGMTMILKAKKAYIHHEHVHAQLQLTSRELEILTLMTEGYTNNQIADKIFSSRRTIEGHRQNLIEKTGSKNTAQLITFAIRQGII